MRRAWSGALASALMLLGACGGDGRSGNAAASPPSGSSSDSAQSPIAVSNTDCDFKGITAGPRNEGECTARGVAISVVDKGHQLHGKDYDARVEDVHTGGTTVTLMLSVTNTHDTPRAFDRQSDLVYLLVDGQYFSEQPSVETATDAFSARSSELQPGETASGTVAFQVPAEQVAHLNAEGSNVIFVNYDDETKGFPTGSEQLGALGYIRLWK